MNKLLVIIVLSLAVTNKLTDCHRAIQPPVPGLPENTDPTKPTAKTTTTQAPKGPFLIDSYLPPSMQALAYYIELLQYEPAELTTLEPPFHGWEAEGGTTYKPPPTSPRPSTTTKSSTIWWKPSSTHSTVWWVPPSTTPRTTTTATRKTTTYTTPKTTTRTTTMKKPITTTNSPTTAWWQTTTTSSPERTTTTTTTTTTIKPVTWWQPPSWWISTTTNKPIITTSTMPPSTHPTPSHKPGLYAPLPPFYTRPQIPPVKDNSLHRETTTRKWQNNNNRPITTTPTPFTSITSDKNFFSWFFQQKAKVFKPEFEYDFNLLDPLPGALIQDIIYERSELPAISDNDNVNDFLRKYDDNFGRSRSHTGKKRIPITKPYVEFLMLYDLLKRDAKAMNFSKYEGYSEIMLHELAELSTRSAERQLHALLTRMLLRNDIERTDVINRVKGIIKDLENPDSITSKAMRYFHPLPFVL